MFRTIPCLLAVTLFAGAAFAQTTPDAARAAEPTPADNCRLPAPDSDASGAQAGGDDTLSETLDDCKGVLRPPAVGDSEIVEPAPATGETPVIRPETLPEQQPAE